MVLHLKEDIGLMRGKFPKLGPRHLTRVQRQSHRPHQIRRVLIIEPVKKHVHLVEPLAAHLLERGWHVTMLAPAEAKHRLGSLVSAHESNCEFLVHNGVNLCKVLLLLDYDYIFLSYGDFYYRSKSENPIGWLARLVRQTTFALGLLVINRRARLVPGIHVMGHMFPNAEGELSTLPSKFGQLLWKIILGRAHAFNVMSRKIRSKYQQVLSISKPILVPPVTIHVARKVQQLSSTCRPLRIVLPGRIDVRLRDYGWIRSLPTEWPSLVNFSFVGIPQGSREREVIQEMAARGFEQPAELDGGFIPEEHYERLVGGAHLLLAPLPELAMGGLKLGEDRAFGIHFSAIRFGKPMLLPRWTPMDEEFEDSIVRYDDHNDLIRKIRIFLERPSALDAVTEKALENARQFTPRRSNFAEALLALERKDTAVAVSQTENSRTHG